MIALVRADDRLLHGLVAVSWTSDVAPETILIANDAAAKDTFLSNTMKMAKPAGVKMGIKSIEGAVKALNNPINDGKKIFLVVESVIDAESIFNQLNNKFNRLNIGTAGVKKQPGQEYRPTLPQVHVSRADYEAAERLDVQGVKVFAQVTPTREKMDFAEIKKVFA